MQGKKYTVESKIEDFFNKILIPKTNSTLYRKSKQYPYFILSISRSSKMVTCIYEA